MVSMKNRYLQNMQVNTDHTINQFAEIHKMKIWYSRRFFKIKTSLYTKYTQRDTRSHCLASGNIPISEGGKIHLNLVTDF